MPTPRRSSRSKAPLPCERCKELQRQLEEAHRALATEREKVNALRLGFPTTTDDSEARSYPQSPGIGPPPFRYVVVDAANDQLKRHLGQFQRATKDLVQWAARLTSGRQEP